MSTVLPDASPSMWTIADVHARLPGFPDNRIHIRPLPGTATEQDVLEAEARTGRICELIDGTLVEKTMATNESMLAFVLGHMILNYLDSHDLGMVAGPDGLLRILRGQIRAPDVSFIRWERLPRRGAEKPAIYPVAPDLAIEIISEGNSDAEMERKLREYFQAGVRLVWYIHPRTRSATAYTAIDQSIEIGPDGSLSGGDVLPGFEVSLARLFARVEGPMSA